MKKLLVVCAVLGCAASALAQDNPSEAPLLTAAQPAAINLAGPAPGRSGPSVASVTLVPAAPAAKTPAPEPAPHFGLREENSWQVSFGYAFVRFRSTLFDANLNGINATVAKYLNEWFAVEGTATAAFAGVPSGFAPGSDARYVFYGGGVRIRGPSRRRLEPWGHAVVGGVHLQPQTAGNSRSGFAFELGGGVDWPWKQQVRLRGQADWVRSQLFGESQNNFQIATGIVFNF